MGSPHLIVIIIKRKGLNGAQTTVAQPYYHHNMYGALVGYILIPLLRALENYPQYFQQHNRSDEEFLNFLTMCVSYNLSEGLRDSHCHIEDQMDSLHGLDSENGVSIIDISQMDTRGPAYCIMATDRYPKSFAKYRPYRIEDYITAYGENRERIDNEKLTLDPALAKIRAYNLGKAYRYYQNAVLNTQGVRLLQRSDLMPIWPDMPAEEAPEPPSEDDERQFELPDRTADAAVTGDATDTKTTSLVDLTLKKLNRLLFEKPDVAAADALQLAPTLQSQIWQQLTRSSRSHLTDSLIPLSFSNLGGDSRVLDLTFCSSLTDAALQTIASSDWARSLRALYISHNDNITATALNALAQRCPDLVDLRVNHCRSVDVSALTKDTKSLMSFSYGINGASLNVFLILGRDRYSEPGQEFRCVWMMKHTWMYGLSALHYLFRAIDHPTPTWMDFGSGGFTSSPYGALKDSDTIQNYVQTTLDHIPGFFTLNLDKGILNDQLWQIRSEMLQTRQRGVAPPRLARLNEPGAPPSGSLVIDLRTRNTTGIKYCFVSSITDLGAATMVPLSARDYASAFYPTEEPARSGWAGSRSAGAAQEILDEVNQLVNKLDTYAVVNLQDLDILLNPPAPEPALTSTPGFGSAFGRGRGGATRGGFGSAPGFSFGK